MTASDPNASGAVTGITRAVVMAAGEGTRWGNYLGVPKHLVDIDGEPLLARTVRQLAERGVDNVVVIGPPDPRYDVPGAYLVAPTFTRCDTDKFLNTLEWWLPSGTTFVVYGDAYLSDAVVDELVGDRWPLKFVGRSAASSLTGCDWGELFAVRVQPEAHGRLAAAILRVRGLLLAGAIPRGGGWEVYRATQGIALDDHRIVDDFVDIDDWSEDFDYPDDFEQWSKRRQACA